MAIILETPRLVVRAMDMADLDFVADQLADPEVMRYWPRPQTREEAVAWVARQQERYERDGYGYWLVLEKATGQPLGQAGLLAHEIAGRPEVDLGYIIHRPYWRRGFATEAASACRDRAFETFPGCTRVIALVRPENTPSRGVALKIGMRVLSSTRFADYEHLVFAQSRAEFERSRTLQRAAPSKNEDAGA